MSLTGLAKKLFTSFFSSITNKYSSTLHNELFGFETAWGLGDKTDEEASEEYSGSLSEAEHILFGECSGSGELGEL